MTKTSDFDFTMSLFQKKKHESMMGLVLIDSQIFMCIDFGSEDTDIDLIQD